MASDIDPVLKRPEDFLVDLEAIEREVHEKVITLDKARPGHRLAVHQAEWHIRGLVYHCRRLVECYQEVLQGVADRVVGTEPRPDVVIMFAPAVQQMWFEFYALVNLSRITLDHLRDLLAPIFVTEFGRLPKSISGYLKGETDCPVYIWLAKQPVVEYLSDMRNCLVHFRSFATGDNALIVREGFDEEEFKEAEDSDWLRPMAKGMFRYVGENGVSANFYVPDVIFDRSGNGEKLARFTYEKRYNVMSQSFAFVRLVSEAVSASLLGLLKVTKPSFHYAKSKK